MSRHMQIISTLQQAQSFFNDLSALSIDLNNTIQKNIDIYNKIIDDPYNKQLLAEGTDIYVLTELYIEQKYQDIQVLKTKFNQLPCNNDVLKPINEVINYIKELQPQLHAIAGVGKKEETLETLHASAIHSARSSEIVQADLAVQASVTPVIEPNLTPTIEPSARSSQIVQADLPLKASVTPVIEPSVTPSIVRSVTPDIEASLTPDIESQIQDVQSTKTPHHVKADEPYATTSQTIDTSPLVSTAISTDSFVKPYPKFITPSSILKTKPESKLNPRKLSSTLKTKPHFKVKPRQLKFSKILHPYNSQKRLLGYIDLCDDDDDDHDFK